MIVMPRRALDSWPYPPPGGWTADDLDQLGLEGPNGEPDFFKRVELIDGVLMFMSPRIGSTNESSVGSQPPSAHRCPQVSASSTRWTSSSITACGPSLTSW
jgi:hypothetical protein